MDIVKRLLEEENRHTIGYPGPRRNVALLLSEARDTITRLTRERDEARALAIEEIATWVEPQRVDVPAHGWEFAAAIRKLGETK